MSTPTPNPASHQFQNGDLVRRTIASTSTPAGTVGKVVGVKPHSVGVLWPSGLAGTFTKDHPYPAYRLDAIELVQVAPAHKPQTAEFCPAGLKLLEDTRAALAKTQTELAEAEDEVDRLKEALHRSESMAQGSAVCCYCKLMFDYRDHGGVTGANDASIEHEAVCPHNPSIAREAEAIRILGLEGDLLEVAQHRMGDFHALRAQLADAKAELDTLRRRTLMVQGIPLSQESAIHITSGLLTDLALGKAAMTGAAFYPTGLITVDLMREPKD